MPVGRWRREHFIAGDLALELANTISHRHDASQAVDRLSDPGDAVTWVSSVTGRRDIDIDEAELAKLMELRSIVHDVFLSVANQNDLDNMSVVRLLHLAARRFEDERPPTVQNKAWSIAAEIAWAAITTLTTVESKRVRSCPSCGWLFLDTSRGGQRRWCAMATCGTREKVRGFRARMGGDK